jgi:hypothetical protein
MSSTNRSNARDSHISDYYVTPINVISNFFSKLEETDLKHLFYSFSNPKTSILDPCAGGDENSEMSYPKAIGDYFNRYDVISMDIRRDSKAIYKEDFLSFDTINGVFIDKNGFDIIITNPPFNIAQEIIEKALSDVNEDGYVIMLLRLNFFGSKKRKQFWRNNMPIATFVHTDRICFTSNGKTDSIEYMHCIWKKGENPESTRLFLI